MSSASLTESQPGTPTDSRVIPITRQLLTAVATGRGSLIWARHITLLLSAVIVLVIGFSATSSIRYGLIFSTVYAILILGNNAVVLALGEINLGAVAFLALGAYTVVNAVEAGVNPYLAILLGVVAGGLVGFILAIPISRLTGLATALVTFALAYSVRDVATYLSPITGGDNGKFVAENLDLFGLQISGARPGMLVVAVVAMVIAGLAHIWLLHRRAGRLAISVGEAPQVATVFGTPSRWVKLGVWAWAGALGGLAGGIYVFSVGFVSSSAWTLHFTIFVFVGGLIGGVRSVTGAWLGGILVGGLPLWLQNVVPPTATTGVFGFILLVALLAGGKGIAEFAERAAVNLYLKFRRTR